MACISFLDWIKFLNDNSIMNSSSHAKVQCYYIKYLVNLLGMYALIKTLITTFIIWVCQFKSSLVV